MFLNLSELQARIELIRTQLISSAETWIDTQNDITLNQIKGNWLNAVKSANRDEMQRKLQEGDVPLVRTDQFIRSLGVASSSSEEGSSSALEVVDESSNNQYYRSVYNPVVDEPDANLVRLSQLTTVFEQLYQLADYLTPLEFQVSFRDLKLAHAMGVSMNNEWCYVEPGVETVRCYTARLQQGQEQFRHASTDNDKLIGLNQIQINIRTRQFEQTLRSLASTVCSAYELEKDPRNRLVRMFSAYLPWHAMFHHVLTSLFGTEGVTHPDKDSISFLDARITEITTLVETHNQIPHDAIIAEYQRLFQVTQMEFEKFNRKLENMRGNLAVADQMGALHHVALFLPTGVTGFYRFFNRLQTMPRLLGQADSSLQDDERLIEGANHNRQGYHS
ncbi:hypothetical protein [Legionella quateirensis]|uniref:Uncharacterized protein n=1 Tax=Legionella quateirensis TaxID=45072 RepID=A0A378KRF3_9GAMM|nr:hypothetical protein [Legionella quateirensis]KTD47844.1 hypothetical protein Lqua_2238 [Legionella quateirensis]STY16739.1 Uncharacterised protein [Legionella quateirensis]